MKTNLKKIVALVLTLAMVLPTALPVLPVFATENEVNTDGVRVYDFSEESQLADFALYQSSNSGFTVADGYLVPDGTSGEMKALLQDTPGDIQSVSVDIYPGVSGLVNVGLYVGASDAAHAADQINARTFLIQSDFTGWADAPNRIDIIHGTFAGSFTELGRTISETGNQNNLFSGGVKQPLHLNLEFTQENIQLTLSLLNDASKSVQCVYDAVDITGLIGLRANASDAKFDNLTITYTPEEKTESGSQYAYVGDFSQSAEPVNELPEGWVRHPNYKNGTLYQQNGALYFDTLTASGVCAAFYDQSEYTDYLIEADITMVEKYNTSRWLGIGYRMNSDENAVNIFNLTWNNNCALSSYYGVAVTGYDGSTINRGWSTANTTYFPKQAFSDTNFPEVLNAGQTTVNMKLAVVGNTLTGYVNGVKILEAITHNQTQETGSFGIVTANTILKIENFRVTDLTVKEEPEESPYAYEGNFSQSAEAVNELPEGWVRHPNYKNGTLYQQNGALYFNTKTASGICAAFYDQSEYSDYLIEADFTMLDRTNDARWMGIAYRASTDEKAINMFFIKYNNTVGINAYFHTETTCYDGTTMKGWGDSRSTSNALSATQYPELVDAGKGTVNLKLKVVGHTITGYVNDVKVLETVTYNATQDAGSFGIITSNADIKVENYRVTDLTDTKQEAQVRDAYAYEPEFSQSEDSALPAGWVRHPSYKNGTLIQKNGALYFNALSASGICTAYYDQTMYTDYLVEADFTMLDRTDNNRWMGFTFRMDNGETATNMFAIKYNNTATIHAYYGSAVTGYDGSTLNRGWAPNDNIHFVSNTLPADKYPTLVDAGKGTVNLKLAVIGNQIYGFVNDVLVVQAVTHNSTQELGSFGIATANTNTKIENFKVTNLTELNQTRTGNAVAHGLTLPTAGTGRVLCSQVPENYVASSTISFADAAAATASTKLWIAGSGTCMVYAMIQKNGSVAVYQETSEGTQTLLSTTATIADTTDFVVTTAYANGGIGVSIDGVHVGYTACPEALPGLYSCTSALNTVTLQDLQIYETVKSISAFSFETNMSEIPYNTTPDWSGLQLTCKLSDGSVVHPQVTSHMITGFDPTASGTQNLTLTYSYGGKTFTENFTVLVGDDPANMPNAKIGIITDVHIGADASNATALEKALQYYKSRGVDAIVCVGDIGHDKMDYVNQFDAIYNSVFPDGEDGPQKFFVMGNHDTYAFENAGYARGTEAHNNAVEEYFTQTFDCEADYGRAGLNYAKIINGYIFVGLYIQTPIEDRAAFLEEIFELPEAQGKPVFIVNHEIPVGSIYIEKHSATSEDYLHDVLVNYPNAVALTGHSHNPLADERALWQGEYTAVSCGALFGPIVERDMYEGGREGGSFQDNNWSAKAALYMEVRDAGINIVRYDFTHDAKLGKDWFIPINDGQIDRTPYNYALRTEAAVAPEFATDAQATAEALSASMVKISFPKAITVYEEMDDIIQSYIIRAYNDDTNELVGQKRVISQHYLGRNLDHDSYSLTFTGLNAATNYRFEVVAVESYQKESSPLVVKADTKKFSTEGVTPTFYANFDYAWDAQEFDFYNHNSTNPLVMTDGVIRAGGNNSSKAIIKDLTFATGTIDTVITKNSLGSVLSAGVYLFASGAADEQDTITAYNVHLDSGAGSKDLMVAIYKFSGKYDKYLSVVTLKDYFADGVNKAGVHLQVEVSNRILSVFVDGTCVMTYTVGNMSGGVGLRSHYSGADFDYIRVYENSVESITPDTAELEALFAEAKELLANTEVEGTESYTGKNPYVTQQTYEALQQTVQLYDNALIRSYDRHVVQVEPLMSAAVETFLASILEPKVVAQAGGNTYTSVAEAIANASGQVVQLLASTDEAIVIHNDVTIDLAGYTLSNVTVESGKLNLIDSTADYTGTKGSAAVTGAVEVLTEHDGKKYMVIGNEGVYAAHRYYVGITHVSLAPSVTGFGYKAQFYGDQAVQAQVENIGYDLWLTEDRVVCRTTGFKNTLTVRLKNFEVDAYGETPVNAKVYMTLKDGTKLESTVQSYSMRTMVETINESYESFGAEKLTAVADMILSTDTMQTWNVSNILKPQVATESVTVENQEMTVYGGETATLSLVGATKFSTQAVLENSPYADWIADYYVSMDKEAGEGLYLTGNYGSYGWIALPVAAGQTYTDVPVVATMLNTNITYTDLVTFVGEFTCGVADTAGNNAGATVTVELRLTNPDDPQESIILNITQITL